jgi:hypothetical protein
MTQILSRLIPDFKTASGQKTHIDGVGQKRAFALVEFMHDVLSIDQRSVDVVMGFLNENVKIAWSYTMYLLLDYDQMQQRIKDFEQYKTPGAREVRVHAGELNNTITFEFPIGAKKFFMTFTPGDTIEETQPVELFQQMVDDATPEQMYGSELCYFTVSGFFLNEPEPDSDDESSSGDAE